MLLLSLPYSCMQESPLFPDEDNDPSDEVVIEMNTQPLKTSVPSSRSGEQENRVREVTALIFTNEGDGYKFRYQVDGQMLTTHTEGNYTFNVRLVKSNYPLKVYIVANATSAVNSAAPVKEESEEAIKKRLQTNFTTAGWSGSLPMFGEYLFPSGLQREQSIEVELLRTLARVDVVNYAPAFVLKTVQFYRIHRSFRLISDHLQNGIAAHPTIPENSANSVNTLFKPVDDSGETKAEHYIPEYDPVDTFQPLQAACVVIGGYYGNDRTQLTYYRMDFIPENSDRQGYILRNHKYEFRITEVSGTGWETPDDAANNNPSSITATIKVWNESTHYMSFDGEHYLRVSTRDLVVGRYQGALNHIEVDTDLEEYTFYWADENGEPDTRYPAVGWGGSTTDTDHCYSVKVASDGIHITVTNIKGEAEGSRPREYAILRAGRLYVNLLFRQGENYTEKRSVTVLSYRQERGYLGSLHTSAEHTYADGLKGILTNKDHFGPNGRIRFDGFNLIEEYSAPVNYLDPLSLRNVDVLYLPDVTPGYLKKECALVIKEWLEGSDRWVLFTNNDDANRNVAILEVLDITPIYTSKSTKDFVIIDNPFNNGPFGQVTVGSEYLRNDDTYAEIDINAYPHLTPVVMAERGAVIAVDRASRIVYAGDVQLFGWWQGRVYKAINNTTGDLNNNPSLLNANIWAWIAGVVLGENF
ncbi:MAG: hypothetical protein LUD15_09905 [Bacteroides sp.]|nr:hypothetical protein [Bacteroides sp.]